MALLGAVLSLYIHGKKKYIPRTLKPFFLQGKSYSILKYQNLYKNKNIDEQSEDFNSTKIDSQKDLSGIDSQNESIRQA